MKSAPYIKSKKAYRKRSNDLFTMTMHKVTQRTGCGVYTFWIIEAKDNDNRVIVQDSVCFDEYDKRYWSTCVVGYYQSLSDLFNEAYNGVHKKYIEHSKAPDLFDVAK